MGPFFILTDPEGGIFSDDPYSISVFTTAEKAEERGKKTKIQNLKVMGPINSEALKKSMKSNGNGLVIHIDYFEDGVPPIRKII